MLLTSLHTHTNYCDGKYSAEDMIQAAIKYNMESIGISTHGPIPYESDWCIKKDNVYKYIDEIKHLKEKYKNSIDVFLGMEIDYIPDVGYDDMAVEIIDKLDYYVGSVHFLGKFNDGVMWTIDYDMDELLRGINESFGGDIRLAIEKYYSCIGEMAYKYEPPIIGHLDLIKKNNKEDILFDENEDWYIKAIDECLDVIKKTSSVIEINTGGISRGYVKEQYPSNFILEMIKSKNIPIIINSDAHTTDGLICKYDEMFKLINDMKFEKVSYLSKDGWKEKGLFV